jgi:phosphinothricin acetyltransferase
VNVVVRDCEDGDVEASLVIYNELVHTTTVAWKDRPVTLTERRAWLAEQRRRGFPVLVAVDDGLVVGVASYGDFRDTAHWEGYRFTVELSIHVTGDRRGAGIGRALMEALVTRARAAGLHVMVAAVDGDNVDSIRFHERLGFAVVARMPEVGYKLGRRLDLVLLQRVLG